MKREESCQRVLAAFAGDRLCLGQVIEKTGMGQGTVSARLADLVTDGRIMCVGRKRKGKQMVRVYKVVT